MTSVKYRFLFVLIALQFWDNARSSAIKDYISPEELENIGDDDDAEIVHVSPKSDDGSFGFRYTFSAFGQNFDLKFEKNDVLLSPNVQVVARDGDKVENIGRKGADCHYIHRDDAFVASISLCGSDGHQGSGFITTADGRTFEIHAINDAKSRVSKRMMTDTWSNSNDTESDEENHRRAKMLKIKKANIDPVENPEPLKLVAIDNSSSLEIPSKKSGNSRRIIETAVFVDEAAYKKFDPYFKKSNVQFRDFIVSYMNGVQSLYHHGSLQGLSFDISIVRIEILTSQPSNLVTHQGERSQLLKSFCKYQSQSNKPNGEPDHWDVGVYISGLDFFANSGGKTSYVTMGLAAVDGICTDNYNCVIAELGVTNHKGRPYPSAGFTSVYVLAHELGHNLGLHHDGKSGNTCEKNGFLMSASRGTKGETSWSSCSVNKLASKEHPCLQNEPPSASNDPLGNNLPGEKWGMDRQCQIFLLDPEARADHTESTFEEICYAVKCRTPGRLGWYRAGPALEGTTCGDGKWCREGKCVKNDKPKPSNPGEWSEWTGGECSSKCLADSKGFRIRHRTCKKTGYDNSLNDCRGKTISFDICDDSDQCSSRKKIGEYASEQCSKFKALVSGLEGKGAQAGYSEKNPKQSCSIYCRRNTDGKSRWYTPIMDLNDYTQFSAFFPDGTLCHTDADGVKYYCQQNACIQEGARSGKSTSIDLDLNQNALPADNDNVVPKALQEFFSLEDDLTPVSPNLETKKFDIQDDDIYEDDDTFEVP